MKRASLAYVGVYSIHADITQCRALCSITPTQEGIKLSITDDIKKHQIKMHAKLVGEKRAFPTEQGLYREPVTETSLFGQHWICIKSDCKPSATCMT